MSKADVTTYPVEYVPARILDEASTFIVGKRDVTEHLLIALLAGGHVLLEGVPGVAKTHIAKTFAKILGCTFRRIQFTPDLLPVDILGSFIFDPSVSKFKLRRGPIFSNIVLIDEVNRGMPKTQSGTIEVMQERQVTIEGRTRHLRDPFMVIATMNPLEVEGVYPLVEAQIDRFMFRLRLGYPSAEEEREMIDRISTIETATVKQVTSPDQIRELSSRVEKVHVSSDIKTYIVNLVRKTRELKEVRLGGSPRAVLHLYKACKARALVEGRDYVIPDDAKDLIEPVLNHRMWLSRETEIEGLKIEDVVRRIVSEAPIPGVRQVGTA